MNDVPLAANPSKMGGPGTFLLAIDDDYERSLITRAINHPPDTTLMHALDLVFGGAAMIALCQGGPEMIHFESGPDLLRLKGIWPTTVAQAAGKWYGLEDFCGDPLTPICVKHVWLRTMMDGNYTDCDYVIGNGHPGGRGGSYKATIIGDAESMSVYTEEVSKMPMRLAMTPDIGREILEFRRLISIGQEIT